MGGRKPLWIQIGNLEAISKCLFFQRLEWIHFHEEEGAFFFQKRIPGEPFAFGMSRTTCSLDDKQIFLTFFRRYRGARLGTFIRRLNPLIQRFCFIDFHSENPWANFLLRKAPSYSFFKRNRG